MGTEKPTVEIVEALLQLRKQLIRQMEWINRPSIKVPQWKQFESRCIVGSEENEEIIFRAHYRPAANVVKGQAVIPVSQSCQISLFINEHRVFGVDSQSDQIHRNKKGRGLPYFNQDLTNHTHVHIWTEDGYGYAEPIEPPILELEVLIAEFCTRAILHLNGRFIHPLERQQLPLLL